MVNLNDAKFGDKLLSCHGEILTYVRKLDEADYYDHEVRYENGAGGTRMNNGKVVKNQNMALPTDHNIVKILGKV